MTMRGVLIVAAAAFARADGVVVERADPGPTTPPLGSANFPAPYPWKLPLASGYQTLYAPRYTWGQKYTSVNITTSSFAKCANLALPNSGLSVSVLITWDSSTGVCSLGRAGPATLPQAEIYAFADMGFPGDFGGSFDVGGGYYALGKQNSAQPCLDRCADYSGAGWCALVLWDPVAGNCFMKGPNAAPLTVTAGVWMVLSPTTTATTAATATSAAAEATVTPFSIAPGNSSATPVSGGDGGSNSRLIGGIVAAIIVLGLLGVGYWWYSKRTNQVEVQEPKPSQVPFSDNHASSLAAVQPDLNSTVIQVPANKEIGVVVPEHKASPVVHAVVPDHKTGPVVDKLMAVMGNLASPLPLRVTKTDYYGDDPTVAVSAFEAKVALESATSQQSFEANESTVVSSSSNQSTVINLADILSWTLQDVSTWVMQNGGSPGAGLRTASEKITGRVLAEIDETVLVQVVQPATVGDRHELVTALRKLKMKTQLLTGPPAYFDL
ncbi:hypothetical protein HDU98_006958 [Podochytrium sp. JEL0797]|nr:hypothetical protein HDU98_006958 [Podochytrium sp. JEL0797]